MKMKMKWVLQDKINRQNAVKIKSYMKRNHKLDTKDQSSWTELFKNNQTGMYIVVLLMFDQKCLKL